MIKCLLLLLLLPYLLLQTFFCTTRWWIPWHYCGRVFRDTCQGPARAHLPRLGVWVPEMAKCGNDFRATRGHAAASAVRSFPPLIWQKAPPKDPEEAPKHITGIAWMKTLVKPDVYGYFWMNFQQSYKTYHKQLSLSVFLDPILRSSKSYISPEEIQIWDS